MGDEPLDRKQIDWTELLFSSTGRMGRGVFLSLTAALLFVTFAYQSLIGPPLYGWTHTVVYAALLFSAACILCKRLHDRGHRGWWAGLVLLALVLEWPQPHGLMRIILLLILAAAFVELGLLPGQRRFNRFGLPA
jgi:uncharacterized membrane protein YhaH (DUF805 family)